MNSKKWIETIRTEWNMRIPGLPNNYEATLIHQDSGMLMAKLLWEEWTELKAAKADLDGGIEPVADALGDLSYLLYGSVAQYGFSNEWDNCDEGFDFDIPDTINELMMCIKANDLRGIRKELKSLELLVKVEATSYGLEGYMDDILDAVHTSNFSKLCDGELLMREDGKILKNKETFKEPDFKFLADLKLSA
jgi:hypothetical protein